MITYNTFLTFADIDGDVQGVNVGKNDDGHPIYFEVETQEVDFGNRAHLKKIADKVVVLSQSGLGNSTIQARQNDSDYKDLVGNLERDVTIIQNVNLEGNFFTFKWFGSTLTTSPVFEGFYFDNVVDIGMTYS